MFRMPFNWSRIVLRRLNIGKTMKLRPAIFKCYKWSRSMELINPNRLLNSTWKNCAVRDNSPRVMYKITRMCTPGWAHADQVTAPPREQGVL